MFSLKHLCVQSVYDCCVYVCVQKWFGNTVTVEKYTIVAYICVLKTKCVTLNNKQHSNQIP